MIEFSAKLTRGGVYFVGEELECWISLRNIIEAADVASLTPSLPPRNSADKLVNLPSNGQLNGQPAATSIAFLSGQIHCQCAVEDSKINMPTRTPTMERMDAMGRRISASTAGLEQNSFCVVSSIPKLLAGNLALEPGEEFNVLFSEIIPQDSSSPSFRGLALRYSWKLAFQCQILGQQTTVIHIPLWIMVIPDLQRLLQTSEERRTSLGDEKANGDASQSQANGRNSPVPDALPLIQNGLQESTRKSLSMDMAMQILDSLTSRRNLKTFSIDSSHGKIGNLTLTKTRFRLGEDIHGKFDFSDRSVTCVQYLVSLIGEEHIGEEHRKPKSVAFSENIVSKAHDFCLCLLQSNFILPVPLYITASFSSEIVDLRWKLRFEFALSAEMFHLEVPSVGNENQSVLWRPPLRVPVETLLWDVPVDIFPTDPIQVHSVHLRDSLVADIRVKL